ncbi:hypothetical protein FRB93_012276, partial [Tulasnella sp. JGI-2019a]
VEGHSATQSGLGGKHSDAQVKVLEAGMAETVKKLKETKATLAASLTGAFYMSHLKIIDLFLFSPLCAE